MVELDVPAMIHVSAACNPAFHTTGSHYLGTDTTAAMQGKIPLCGCRGPVNSRITISWELDSRRTPSVG